MLNGFAGGDILKDLLATYYDIHVDEKREFGQKECFKNNEYYYFTILANNREVIHMEQAALAYYLMEQNYDNVAIPIPNIHGDWFTNYQEKNYLVLQFRNKQEWGQLPHGKQLAVFHETGIAYRYEPKEISSYGQWKELWINKLTAYETNVERQAKENPCDYYRYLMDVLPYIIGISENAIQYIQESEEDTRFHEVDQGTISFRRYKGHLENPVIWVDDLAYDHPARDLAEYIRLLFLHGDDGVDDEVAAFLHDYQSVRTLSVFSWRLVYARLIFPIHIFDQIERGFTMQNVDQHYKELAELLEKQMMFEKRLAKFFERNGIDHDGFQIPVLHWL